MKFQKIAFIFPGQGAQYPGMAKDFVDSFATARQIFEEADELLQKNLSKVVLEGPEETLTITENSQLGIYLASLAILRVVQQEFPEIAPGYCAGLSLGEYTALTAAEKLPFKECLPLVQKRGQYMSEACDATEGTMAAIIGLEGDVVERTMKDLNLPNDLWVANFNCPGQVVISGTKKGIEAGIEAAKAAGARRAMPLTVHGAFHSGLMQSAQDRLAPHIAAAPIRESGIALIMNVSGKEVNEPSAIRQQLIDQVTHSVRWEKGIGTLVDSGVDLFIEMGPGKTLAGMNKRIKVEVPTVSIEKVEEIKKLEEVING